MNDAANTDPFANVLAFEASLVPGASVEARWTNCGNYYRAAAKVVKVNKSSVRVEITDPKSYLHGRQIPVPLIMGNTWSVNNCVVAA